MARVELLKQESAIAEHLLLSTSKCIANSGINKIVDKFKRAGLDMCRVTRTERQLQHCGKQSENPYRPEDLIWKSNNGIFTRSKSERDFCNRLEAYGIPYHYEKRMVINVSGLDDMKGVQYYEGVPYKIIYPDFTIFLADGTILIIEHLGRVDSKDYRQRNGEKMIALLHSGIVDHDHLLITFEKDFRTPDIIDDYIERLILPYV
ncbi:MAG: hypothetical protein IJ070_03960 [Firmicutes bacterium]|nr:hypothetical protein [Bacillota bacterium]